MSVRLGVIGNPVFQSASPQLHEAALKSAGLSGHSLRIAAADAKDGLQIARQLELRGINVTAPFKESIVRYLDSVDPFVTATGAANTVLFEEGCAHGFNTDVAAIDWLLQDAGVGLQKAECIVLGAGGAASAAAVALTRRGALVTIANRDLVRAKELAERVGARTSVLDDTAGLLRKAKVIVNTVPAQSYLRSPFHFHRDQVFIEANYAFDSELVRAARAGGARVLGGMEWLHAQGATSASIFLGRNLRVEQVTPPSETQRTPKPAIALIGMMGSGKSSVAVELASLLGSTAIDLDARFAELQGRTIAAAVTADGEEPFRRIEAEILSDTLRNPPAVIACGGGAVLSSPNRELLSARTHVVWLYAPVETLINRVDPGETRPLLRGADRRERLKQLFDQRRPYYEECSELMISTEHLNPRQIARRIFDEIHYLR